jgi:hypothetical protein
MIQVLPVILIIRVIAVLYAVLCAIVFLSVIAYRGGTADIASEAALAFSGAGGLQLFLMAVFYSGWRLVWKCVPAFGDWIYPDLTGTWVMQISLVGPDQSDRLIAATAVVRQNLLRISMDVTAPDSTSLTLAAIPKKAAESGLPQLYYVFQVTTRPKGGKASETYQGAAILDLDHLGDGELRGNYWTTKPTTGSYRIFDRA